MIHPVEYAKTLDGKLVAVERGPYEGWAFGDQVFATEAEARAADGRSAQRAYLEQHVQEIDCALCDMVNSAGPFAEWREKYDEYERTNDLSRELTEDLFPRYSGRSDRALRFVSAFLTANAVWEEMHPTPEVSS